MIPLDRNQLFSLANEERRAGGLRTIVHVFCPPEWLHDLELDEDKASEAVSSLDEVLRSLDVDGNYSHIGWTSFIMISTSDEATVERAVSRALEHLQFSGHDLWKFALRVLNPDTRLLTAIQELEWKSYEQARLNGSTSLSRRVHT